MNFVPAHIFDGMRRQGFNESGRLTGRGRMLPRIEQHVSLGVVAHEIAACNRIVDCRPAVRVNGNEIAGWDVCIQNTNPLVIEHKLVMIGRSN